MTELVKAKDDSQKENKTRTALLDMAEQLFTKHGVTGVSIRDIAKAAGANLGAVNYHFESKDRLVLAVFARRIEPLNQDRLARMDVLESRPKPPSVEEVLDALIRPAVMDESSGKGRAENFLRVIIRAAQEPGEEIKSFLWQKFGPVVLRFDAAIMKAVPGLTKEELFWRMQFIFGGLHQALDRLAEQKTMPLPPGLKRSALQIDQEGFLKRFIGFMAAGLRASAQSDAPR